MDRDDARDDLPSVMTKRCLACFGAWVNTVWIVQMSRPFMEADSNLGSHYLLTAAPAILPLAVLALVLWRRPQGRTPRWADWAGCAGMLVGYLMLRLYGTGVPVLTVIAAIIVSCGFSWMWIRWGSFYAGIGLMDAGSCILVAFALGELVNIPLIFAPSAIVTMAMFALPVLSVVFLRGAFRNPPAQPEKPREVLFTRGAFSPVWCAALCLFICNLVLMLGNAYVDEPRSPLTDSLQFAFVSLLCLGLLYLIFIRRVRVDFPTILAFMLILIATSLLLLVAQDAGVSPLWLNTALLFEVSHRLVEILTLVIFADIARHSDIHPLAVFSVALLVRLIPVSLMSLPIGMVHPAELLYVVPALIYVIVLTICLVYRRRADFQLMFKDLQEPSPGADAFEAMHAKCREIGQRHGLTDREVEVLELIGQGRSKSYIAETLFISENTVKGHGLHIYQKLGVHSRTDIQKMLGF